MLSMELQFIKEQIIDIYEGDPWFGRNISSILLEIDESKAFVKPSGQHSIVELIWHMINWREFVLSRFSQDAEVNTGTFESNDWRLIDHADHTLFPKAVKRFAETQKDLITAIEKLDDSILTLKVPGRTYNYRKLLHGLLQHDIYHTGQIAFLHKMLNYQN